jgi:hypothetical protein
MTEGPTSSPDAALHDSRDRVKSLLEGVLRSGRTRLWEDCEEPPGERRRPARGLRADLEELARQRSPEAAEALCVLSDEALLEVAEEVERELREHLPLREMLERVAFERGRWIDLQVWAAQGDFEDIRVVFQAVHRDRPELRHVLGAVSNRALREAVQQLQKERAIPRRRRAATSVVSV